jgi:acetyl esterase/lipase
MNLLVKIALKIISLPIFDMTRDYEIVRRFQDWAAKNEELPPDFVLFDEKIISPDGAHYIPVRVFTSLEENHNGILLFFHGGGFVIGNVETYTLPCLQLVKQTGLFILSVDYRLAPEHPFPKGLDDCYEVLKFLVTNTSGRFRPLTVMGDSAGGNLAAVACKRLLDQNLPLPDQQILIYPAVSGDYSESSPFPSMHEKAEDFGLTRKKLMEYYEMYVPEGMDNKSSEIAPLSASNLSGMPRTLIITAEHDPLRDEGEAYAEKLRSYGVDVTMKRILNVPHGFWTYERPFSDAINQLYENISLFIKGKNDE